MILRKKVQQLDERISKLNRRDKQISGVMLMPKMLPLDEWERLVMPAQAELIRHVKSDESGPPNYSQELIAWMSELVPHA